jgi:hypothetical protein
MTNIQTLVSETIETSQRQHNTSETSKLSFIETCNDGTIARQKKIIYRTVQKFGPITSRQLSILTKQERSSVCRSLYDLLNEVNAPIKVAFIDRCPITKRKVKFYSVLNWSLQLFQ